MDKKAYELLLNNFCLKTNTPNLQTEQLIAIYNDLDGMGMTEERLRVALKAAAGQDKVIKNLYGAIVYHDKLLRGDAKQDDFQKMAKLPVYNKENAEYGKKFLSMVAGMLIDRKNPHEIKEAVNKFYTDNG